MSLCLNDIYKKIELERQFNELASTVAEDIDGFCMKIENQVITSAIGMFKEKGINAQVISDNAMFRKFFFNHCAQAEQIKALTPDDFLELGFKVFISRNEKPDIEFHIPKDEHQYEVLKNAVISKAEEDPQIAKELDLLVKFFKSS